jgi:hypothetical protein
MQSSSQSKESTFLRFLLVSDIHLAFENVEKLVVWLSTNRKDVEYDYVLGSGDFGNINHTLLPEDNKAETAA